MSAGIAAPADEAAAYDRWFDSAWGCYAFDVECAALDQAVGLLDDRRILDVGCGTGKFTAAMEQRGGSVTGIDLDPAILAVAARRVRAPLLAADAQRLPFGDATFDVTVAVTACEFVADPHLVAGALSQAENITPNRLTATSNRPAVNGCVWESPAMNETLALLDQSSSSTLPCR